MLRDSLNRSPLTVSVRARGPGRRVVVSLVFAIPALFSIASIDCMVFVCACLPLR